MTGRILVVDDERAMCELVEESMRPLGFEVDTETSGAGALELLGESEYDVVLTDLRMKGMTGLELCTEIRDLRPDLPVVLFTAFGTMDAAVQAMRAGAYDFLSKPVELEAMELVLRRAIEHHKLSREVHALRREVQGSHPTSAIIGESAPMKRVLELIPRAARADVSVLVTGETGTGKELVARELHAASPRSEQPFVAVNCAAIPENLLESELFGHVRGAFTDARTARRGLFLEAGTGTLFLDELGELPLALQPKLLRAIQEAAIRPVGADREQPVQCRVIAASNRDLKREAEAGRFRSDLYYRLAVIRISLPPLRVRDADILLLAQHFLDRAAERMERPVVGFTTSAARALLAYAWPGNVRELENCVERAVALTTHDRLLLEDLPDEVREVRPVPTHGPMLPLSEVERLHIERVLDAAKGNKVQAARILGLDRRTLYRKLDRYQDE